MADANIGADIILPILCLTQPLAWFGQSTVICLRSIRPGGLWLVRGLLSLTRTAATRSYCLILRSREPNPLALLSVARSPSQEHCCPRWWALTPPFQPLPRSIPSHERSRSTRGGNILCCGCSRTIVANGSPPLTVSWGNFAVMTRLRVGKFLYWLLSGCRTTTQVTNSDGAIRTDLRPKYYLLRLCGY